MMNGSVVIGILGRRMIFQHEASDLKGDPWLRNPPGSGIVLLSPQLCEVPKVLWCMEFSVN